MDYDKNMIGIEFSGRLGNQMFQYAFGLKIKKKINKKVFFIFHRKGLNKTVITKYFELKDYNPIFNYFYKIRYVLFKKKKIIKISTLNYDADLLDNKIIQGFFQSEEYFYPAIEEVKINFIIKKKYIDDFEKKYKKIFEKYKIIALHIRRGDYETFGNDFVGYDLRLPISYYKQVLKKINNIDGYRILIIGDDINSLEQYFKDFHNVFFERNSMIVDFQILQNADICVISNSTFAWWGAYLSKKNNSIVYAPKYWLGYKVKKEYPSGIMSVKKWNWIEI